VIGVVVVVIGVGVVVVVVSIINNLHDNNMIIIIRCLFIPLFVVF